MALGDAHPYLALFDWDKTNLRFFLSLRWAFPLANKIARSKFAAIFY